MVGHIVASSAARAPLTAPARTASGEVISLTANTDAEKHGGDEERGPCSPGEAEGVLTDLRVATHGVELVAHSDEGGRHERCGDCVEKERDR